MWFKVFEDAAVEVAPEVPSRRTLSSVLDVSPNYLSQVAHGHTRVSRSRIIQWVHIWNQEFPGCLLEYTAAGESLDVYRVSEEPQPT